MFVGRNPFLMKSLVSFLLLLLSAIPLSAQDSIATFTFEKPLQNKYVIVNKTEILVDSGGTLSLLEVQQMPQSAFSTSDYKGDPTTIWQRIRFQNNTDYTLNYKLFLQGDTIDAYEMNADGITSFRLGRHVVSNSPKVGGPGNSLPLYLQPGGSKTYYIRADLCDCYLSGGFNTITISTEKSQRLHGYFGVFFSGIVIVIALMSMLLFALFRDKQYLVMGLPLIGILFYFSVVDRLLFTIFNISTSYFPPLSTISAWFIIVCFAFYSVFYLHFRKKIKWVFWLIVGLVLLHTVVSGTNLFLEFTQEGYSKRTLTTYANILTLILIVSILAGGFYLSIRGDKLARIWALFVTPIATAGFITSLVLMRVITFPINPFLLFKISALFACGIIGYSLYHRVNATIQQNIRTIKEKERIVSEQNVLLEQKVEERTRELVAEKEKSDTILLNILPEEVANELKETGGSEARLYDNVSVLFTDFVGFTMIAEQMTAKELVSELHNCFKSFDEIIQKYGLEKIKTVGDAYIAVAGLPVPVPDHAQRVAKAALAIRDFMMERQQEKVKTFGIRIGINTGPVVAGIVGVKKFAYDIWGDTVNTAARMEQHSETGQINISETTYTLIRDSFDCISRGKILAKNKGNMEMYFLRGPHKISQPAGVV